MFLHDDLELAFTIVRAIFKIRTHFLLLIQYIGLVNMKKIEVDLPIIPNFTHAICNGNFTIAMTNPTRDELKLYKQKDGYILKYHDMTCNISDDDAKKFIHHCVKVVDEKEERQKEQAKLTPPYSKAEKLMGCNFPKSERKPSLIRRIFKR